MPNPTRSWPSAPGSTSRATATSSHDGDRVRRLTGAGAFAALLLGGAFALASTFPASAAIADATGAPSALRTLVPQAAATVCQGGIDTPPTGTAQRAASQHFSAPGAQGEARGWRVGPDLLLRVTKLEPQGQGGFLYFVDAYRDARASGGMLVPLLRGVINGRCKFMGGQDVLYSSASADIPLGLQKLGPELQADGPPVPLNPVVPDGAPNPACLRVGILDNGVNYLLPEIASRLARDANGKLVGHDYWEGDDRPFDYGYQQASLDPRISPFSPRHHGTGVASVFLALAPASACIVPDRYLIEADAGSPSDAGKIIADMAAEGVRIVNLSSGRDRPWPEFKAAMQAHPEMLFVIAAGNDGRDLAAKPSYPAAYRLDNVLIVGATEAGGQLWKDSNRGPVDVAVLGVDIPGTVADGSRQKLTGTSLAAPRIAALAAQVLAKAPKSTGAALKQAIVAEAKASGVVADAIPVITEAQLKP